MTSRTPSNPKSLPTTPSSTQQPTNRLNYKDLLRLEEWEQSWVMELYPAKYEAIRSNRKPGDLLLPPTSDIKGTYYKVPRSESPEWPEVARPCRTFHSQGIDHLRIRKGTSPAQSTANYITVDPVSIEYACSSWDPLPKVLINKVGAVQRHSAKDVYNTPRISLVIVSAMIQKLNWELLKDCRQ